MPKEIKKFYNFMNLSYSSSFEEVQDREKVMIKVLRAKAIKKHQSYNDEINKVVASANGIMGYIEKNGVPNKRDFLFNTSKSSLISQIIVLMTLLIVLGFSIYSLI